MKEDAVVLVVEDQDFLLESELEGAQFFGRGSRT